MGLMQAKAAMQPGMPPPQGPAGPFPWMQPDPQAPAIMPPLPPGGRPAPAPGSQPLGWLDQKEGRRGGIAAALMGFGQSLSQPGASLAQGVSGASMGMMQGMENERREKEHSRRSYMQELQLGMTLGEFQQKQQSATRRAELINQIDDPQERLIAGMDPEAWAKGKAEALFESEKPQIYGSAETGYYKLDKSGKELLTPGVGPKAPTTAIAAMLADAPPEERGALAQKLFQMQLAAQERSAPRVTVEGSKIMMPEVRGPSLTYEADKKQIEAFGNAWSAAELASSDVNAMADLALKGRQAGGPVAPLKNYLTNLATSVGVDLSPEEIKQADDAKLFEQVGTRMQRQSHIPGTGAQSDKDMQIVQKSIPQLTDTKDQQVYMALALKQQNEWALKTRDVVTQHLHDPKTGATLAGVDKKIKEQVGTSWLPKMTREEAQAQGQPVLFLDKESGVVMAWTPD
jgi:hypothetical protein